MMILRLHSPPSSLSSTGFFNPKSRTTPTRFPRRSINCINLSQIRRPIGLSCNLSLNCSSSPAARVEEEPSDDRIRQSLAPDSSVCGPGFCSCGGRRHFIQAIGTTFFSNIPPSSYAASPTSRPDPTAMLNSIHPPRADWYEEFYASVMDKGMKSYEAEVADYKSQLFTKLRGKAKTVLEIGIGTGPNLRYYAGDNGVCVFGVDPNRKMEKYAQAAALTAGLSAANFKFTQAVLYASLVHYLR